VVKGSDRKVGACVWGFFLRGRWFTECDNPVGRATSNLLRAESKRYPTSLRSVAKGSSKIARQREKMEVKEGKEEDGGGEKWGWWDWRGEWCTSLDTRLPEPEA